MLVKLILLRSAFYAARRILCYNFLVKNINEISGIDFQKVLLYFDGDIEIFDEVLKVAVDDAENKILRLKNAFEQKNFLNYQNEAHSLKSSLATFGVEKLAERAKKHEFAAKENNIEFIKSDYEEFVVEYKKFISEAANYLGK